MIKTVIPFYELRSEMNMNHYFWCIPEELSPEVPDRSEAIATMNQWGTLKVPFLFIIDFEMKAIRLFRLDHPLPDSVCYHFNDPISNFSSSHSLPKDFFFHKHPVAFADYESAFITIRKQIMAGNSFLANLTFPTPIETNLSLREIYEYSQAPYKVMIEGKFVCFSPETFVRIRNGVISTFPMKGTIDASLPGAYQTIMENAKETAEHHTVVDLLRNDLSIVATDVVVKRFRYIDSIITHHGELLQVSSEISGTLRNNYQSHLGDILFALLPAGSVTGAPKIKTVSLIREVEKTSRGYYTGVCGIFDGEAVESAVMIRLIEMHEGKMRFRSGGGITFQSNARDEYNELINKVYVPIA